MQNGKELIPAEKEAVITEFLGFAAGLRDIVVSSNDEYNNVADLCKKIKAAINTLEGDRKELVAPYKQAATEIDGRYREIRTKLENGEAVAKRAMGAWVTAQEQKRLEAQRKAEAEAAEERRKAAERAAKEAAKAEAYREAGRDKMADAAEARAETAQAEAETIVAPVISSSVASPTGISYRTTYSVVIDDQIKAVRGLAADVNLIKFLSIDITKLEKLIAACGGDYTLPDGLRIIKTKTPIVRGK